LQETVPVDEKRGSINSILPNCTFSTVVGLLLGVGGWARLANLPPEFEKRQEVPILLCEFFS